MKLFKRRQKPSYSVLTEEYHPVTLPSYGQNLETIVPCDYVFNQPEVIEQCYKNAIEKMDSLLNTCDHHSSGHEVDYLMDGQCEHLYALHESEIAHHNNQITRIRNVVSERINDLFRKIEPLGRKADELEKKIEPLKDLRQQFKLRLGPIEISVGTLVTVLAMAFDAAINYNKLQDLILSSPALLAVTVIVLSIMSDGSMWGLGTLLSHKNEDFMPRKFFDVVCIGLGIMFIVSVFGSILIHWGSMASTYGTLNAKGEFVAPETYSLAQYGTTLIMCLATTCTGLLSFGFSYDTNGYKVSYRKELERDLNKCRHQLDPLLNELMLLLEAPDPKEYDDKRREAAEQQLENIRRGIKQVAKARLTERINDPSFTEKMSKDADYKGITAHKGLYKADNSQISYGQMS